MLIFVVSVFIHRPIHLFLPDSQFDDDDDVDDMDIGDVLGNE